MISPRRFVLVRDVDLTGMSGTGIVTEGIEFSDGVCAMRWTSTHKSTCVYDTIIDLVAIHGHDGATRVVYLDDDEYMIDLSGAAR